ncbi:hypothetical protein [Anaeromusa acidaminophila]|uniref:hypothetical protein n=1 Tax=Anaeromusa acidaminophila TaxID=81464 RepID=UPI0003609804|nr:hypothetical protein [Anaeromusa acidaminophila]
MENNLMGAVYSKVFTPENEKVMHFNQITLQGTYKTSPNLQEVMYTDTEILNRWRCIVGCESPTKKGFVPIEGTDQKRSVPFLSRLSVMMYGEKAVEASQMVLENDFVNIVGEIREVILPTRQYNAADRNKVAELLEVDFASPLLDKVFSALHMYSKKYIEYETMIGLLGTECYNKEIFQNMQTTSKLHILADSVVQGTEEYQNRAILQGIVFQEADIKPWVKNAVDDYKVCFKLMVRRSNSERFDVIRCIWRTQDWQLAHKIIRPGQPLHVRGSLEHENYRMSYVASQREKEELASILKVDKEHPVIVGTHEEPGIIRLLDLIADPLTQKRPGKKIDILTHVWVENIYYKQEELLS